MTLRTRLLLAQGPLALALALVGVLAVATLADLGKSGQRILADNYRSVLAAQRMKEAIERIDSAALFLVIREDARGLRQASENRPRFESREPRCTRERHLKQASQHCGTWAPKALDTPMSASSTRSSRESFPGPGSWS